MPIVRSFAAIHHRNLWHTAQRKNLSGAIGLRSAFKTAQPRAKSESHAQAVKKIWLPLENATYRLGHILGRDPRASDVFLLHGELGAGKTAFARGYIQAALRDDTIAVTSPTFLLTNSYASPTVADSSFVPEIFHMDLWRLDDASSRPIVNFEKVFSEGIALIEWPDRLGKLMPENYLEVRLEYPPVDDSAVSDSDDPWGFGNGELDELGAAREGRYATLKGQGNDWESRVEHFYRDFTHIDEEGRVILGCTDAP